jgi:hypothetical protein
VTVRLREGRELKGLMKRRREKDKTTGEREENEGLGWVLFLFAPSSLLHLIIKVLLLLALV